VERIVFVEILDRRGRVRERVRLAAFPATIGRSYTNNIIIDDKHVSPEHVRITLDENGTLIADDTNSVNGMYQDNLRKRVQQITINPDTHIRIGQTVLRFRGPDFAVSPAQLDKSAQTAPARFFTSGFVALTLFLLSLVVLTLNKFFSSSDEFTFNKVLENLFIILLLFAFWAGIWSFVNRLVTHQFRFLPHLGLTGGVVVVFIILKIAAEYWAFLRAPGILDDALELPILGLACFLLLFGHLTILSGVSFVKRLSVSLLVAIILFGGIGFHVYLDGQKFSGDIPFRGSLKPLAKKWLQPVSMDVFFKDAETMKQELEKAAAKE
jgi:pSer/pThr/pTyr-binding forkhead associated (FHA) protein